MGFTKTEVMSSSIEAVKMKISDNDVAIRSKLKESMQPQESILNDQLLLFEKIKDGTNDQIRELSAKIEDIPRSLQYNEIQQSEFKRYIAEMLQKENENNNHLLTDIRENVQTKVSDLVFERMQ